MIDASGQSDVKRQGAPALAERQGGGEPFHPKDPRLEDAEKRGAGTRTALWLAAGVTVIAGLVAAFLLTREEHHAAAAPKSPIEVNGNAISLSPDAPQWRYVEMAVAAEQEPLAPLPAPGRVAFDLTRTSAVSTPLAGRVDQVLVRLGDRVRKGARLFSVRSGAFADVEKDVETARVDVALKKRLAERARDLVNLKAAPEKDALAAEAELHQAELSLSAAEAKLESLRISADGNNLFWVSAPRDGTVVELDVFANQEVTPDREKPLLKISDLDEVVVLADAQEADVADLAPNTPVEVHAQGFVKPGVVEHVAEIVDPARRTVEVRVRAKNADRKLRPNAYVDIVFGTVNGGKRIRVPSEAVVTDGERAVVFVAKDANKLERVEVTTGRQRDGQVEVLSGLAAGSRYVARGALLLLNQIELAQ